MGRFKRITNKSQEYKDRQIRTCSGDNMGIKKGLRAHVSPGTWSYIINENGNAMRVTFQQFGSCTPELYLQGWLDGLSAKKKREISKRCDKAKDIVE